MAKIAVVTSFWSDSLQEYCELLANQHNQQVTLVTSSLLELPELPYLQVLTPFKNWTPWESLQLLAKTFSHHYDVWQFFIDSSQPAPAPLAVLSLAVALQVKPNTALCVSVLSHHQDFIQMKYLPALLRQCDLATFACREDLMFAKRSYSLPASVQAEIWSPLVLGKAYSQEQEPSPSARHFTESLKDYFVVPSLAGLCSLQKNFPPEKENYLVLESPQSWSQRQGRTVFFAPQIEPQDLLWLLRKSQGLILAFEEFSIFELTYYQSLCETSDTALLCNPGQQEVLPGLVQSEKNGVLFSPTQQPLAEALKTLKKIKVKNHTSATGWLTKRDSSMNDILRAFTQIQVRRERARALESS